MRSFPICDWRLVVVAVLLFVAIAIEARAVSVLDHGAKGDNKTDDTKAIQRAVDAASAKGDEVLLPAGTYRVTGTIKLDGAKAWALRGHPGTHIRFDPPAAAVTDFTKRGVLLAAISIRPPTSNGPDSIATKLIDCITFLGPRQYAPPIAANYKPGIVTAIDARHTTRGTLRDVKIVGFTGPGLYMEHCYRWQIYNLMCRYNDWGVRCAGVNGTSFHGLEVMYNLYGCENIQSFIGGLVEGNQRSGARYTEIGHRYSLHDVWFEQNNLANTVAGEADIWANSRVDKGDGDAWILPRTTSAGSTWKPVGIAISGATTFHNTYGSGNSDIRKVATHNIAGCVALSVSGSVRFFGGNPNHNFHLHPWSQIVDDGAVDPMIGVPNGFSGSVKYASPQFGTVGPE